MVNKNDSTTRREFVAGGLLTASALVFGQSLGAQGAAKPELKWRFLCEIQAELENPQDIGDRKIYIAKGGTIRGPRVQGTILPGGGDWAKRRTDGSALLDVRATIKTNDDQLIYVHYHGISATKEFGRYLRTTPYFETASEKYAWMNTIVAVGVVKPFPGGIGYDVFEIL